MPNSKLTNEHSCVATAGIGAAKLITFREKKDFVKDSNTYVTEQPGQNDEKNTGLNHVIFFPKY